MTPTPPDTLPELPEEVQNELDAAAVAAELSGEEVERVTGLVHDGLRVDEALESVLADRDAEEEEEAETAETGPAPPSPEEMERIFSALERQAVKHREKVMELAGPLAGDLAPCPLCQEQAPGFYLHDLPPEDAQARIQAVTAILSGGIVPEFRVSEQVERCNNCDGWGRVLSGSRVPDQATVPCSGCSGSGHKPKVQPPTPPAPLPLGAGEPVPAAVPGGQGGMPDAWGRPAGHPHYGLHPAQVTA